MGSIISKLKINVNIFKCKMLKSFRSSCCKDNLKISIENLDHQHNTTYFNCCCMTYYNSNDNDA